MSNSQESQEGIKPIDAVLELSRRHLMDFCILMDRTYKPSWHHELIAEHLEAVERGELKRLVISMPPRHGKSWLSSVMFPAWCLGRNFRHQVVAASYGAELATHFGSKTRDLVSSPEYRAIFPVALREDSQAKNKWEVQSNIDGKWERGGHYLSVGVGGALTGRGADLLLIDDPHKSRAEVESEVVRKSIWEWYTSVAYTRLSPQGAIVIIGTRWRDDDLIGRVLAQDSDWTVITLPAVAVDTDEHRVVGEALWPQQYSLQALEEIKSSIGVYDWSALYQCTPIASENQEFRQEYFKYFEQDDLKGKDLYITACVDLAIGKDQDNDRTAIVTVGKEVNGPNWYVLDVIVGRLDPLETIEAIFSVYAKYRHAVMGIETTAYQRSLIYFLQEEMKRRRVYLPLEELKAIGPKEVRIRGLHPMYKTGVIYHRKNQSELEHELLSFPKGTHDDIIDSLAYHLQLLPNTIEREPPEHSGHFDPFALTG